MFQQTSTTPKISLIKKIKKKITNTVEPKRICNFFHFFTFSNIVWERPRTRLPPKIQK